MLGERINKGRILSLFNRTGEPTKFWEKIANRIMKKPILFLVISVIFMGIFAIPTLDMKLNTNDITILPVDSAVRSGYEMYTDSFATSGTSTNSLIVQVNEGKVTDQSTLTYLTKLQNELMQHDNINQVSSILSFVGEATSEQASVFLESDPASWPAGLQPMIDRSLSRDGQTAVLDMNFKTDGASSVSQALIKEISEEIIPESEPPEGLSFIMGGDTAQAVDMNKAVYDGLLPALFIMLGLIYLILLITCRSRLAFKS